MRAVFVNYAHPDKPHVSSMRLRHFAEMLARKGHQIVLLTSALHENDVPKPVGEVALELASHNWAKPYFLACPPKKRWSLELIRNPRTPRHLRQWLVFWNFAFGGGVFADWTDGSRPYWPLLAGQFKPNLTWGTFVHLDSWIIARSIAKLADVPWVADVKDGWEVFIPGLLRRLLAWQFRDAAALTANSGYMVEQLARWFPQRAELIYSGVGEHWLQPPLPAEGFRIQLVGGIYDLQNLARLSDSLRVWLERLGPHEREQVSVCYAGSDTAQVESAMAALMSLCHVDIKSYMPTAKLAGLCRSAAVNVYLWSHKTFHHKLVELLCSQRPIISFPGERAESVELARRVGGSLNVCDDGQQIQRVLDQAWRGELRTCTTPEQLQSLTWKSQATLLEQVFNNVLARQALFPAPRTFYQWPMRK